MIALLLQQLPSDLIARSSTDIHFDLESELNAVMFPGLRLARRHAVFVDQVKGETIFVPSGWHHSVENLEVSVSILSLFRIFVLH